MHAIICLYEAILCNGRCYQNGAGTAPAKRTSNWLKNGFRVRCTSLPFGLARYTSGL